MVTPPNRVLGAAAIFVTDRTPPWTRAVWISIVVSGLVAVALTLFGASGGVRGTDQYWYLADVESLVRHGAVSTNAVLPVWLLGSHASLPPPFIHNDLGLYLAALPAVVFGPFGGWLALNLAATLATAVLIYLAARTIASRWAALLSAILYPLLPVTVWLTAQPLAETSTSLFAALAIYLVAVAGTRPSRWLAVLLAVGLLYFSRQSYLPLLVAVPVAFLIVRAREHPRGVRGALVPTAAFAMVAVAVAATAQVLFAARQVNFSYTRLLHSAVPGQTDNMWFNFDLSQANLTDRLPLDLGLVAPKLAGGLAEQFVVFGSLPIALMYWIFNGLAIVAILSLLRYRQPLRVRIILAALSLVAIHFVTVVLFQNQFRYTLPAIPGLLVVLAIVLSDVRRLARFLAPKPVAMVLGVTLIAVVPNAYLARTARDEGLASATVQRAAEVLLDRYLSPDEPALVVFSGGVQVLSYAARPRPILYVLPTYTPQDYRRLLEALPSHWILAPTGSQALATLSVPAEAEVGEVEASGTHWGLYELPAPSP